MIETLSSRFRTYAVDAIYDVGKSVSSRQITSPLDVTSWLDELLDSLGFENGVNLMGLSMGSWVTAEYSLKHPARLASTVWLSPAGVVAPFRGLHRPRSDKHASGKVESALLPGMEQPDAARATGPAREFYDRILHDLILSSASFKNRPFPGGPRFAGR
jgi:pimeloyl-ACP methyl ester carboxylesterase